MKNKRLAILLLIFLYIFTLVYIINKKSSLPWFSSGDTPTIKDQSDQILPGKMTVKSTKGEYQPINSLVQMNISATSGVQSIVGYDIEITYDENYLEFDRATNLMEERFDFFINQEKNRALITGIKKLTDKDRIEFNNTPVVNLQFKTKKFGRTTITLVKENNSKKESNLISEDNKDILGSVNKLSLNIGQPIILKKNQPLEIEKEMFINLTDFGKALETCRDCITFANLTVNKDGKTKELSFKTGGFTGMMVDHLQAFDYFFVLESVNSSQVNISFYEI